MTFTKSLPSTVYKPYKPRFLAFTSPLKKSDDFINYLIGTSYIYTPNSLTTSTTWFFNHFLSSTIFTLQPLLLFDPLAMLFFSAFVPPTLCPFYSLSFVHCPFYSLYLAPTIPSPYIPCIFPCEDGKKLSRLRPIPSQNKNPRVTKTHTHSSQSSNQHLKQLQTRNYPHNNLKYN